MQSGAAERRVPARIPRRRAWPAEVATEPPGRPTSTAESPVRVCAGPTRYSRVNAEISAGAAPWPEGLRALTAEARPEVPGWRAGPVEASMETGIGPTRSAEVPAEVRCGSSRTPEVPMEATVWPTRRTIESTWPAIGSTRPTEVTAQRGGWRSGGVRSR